jgi:hypothetical protein
MYACSIMCCTTAFLAHSDVDFGERRVSPLLPSACLPLGCLIFIYQLSALEAMSAEEKSAYEQLGIELEATDAEIRKAYRTRSLKIHPDKVRAFTYVSLRTRRAADDSAGERSRTPTILMHVRLLLPLVLDTVLTSIMGSTPLPRAHAGIRAPSRSTPETCPRCKVARAAGEARALQGVRCEAQDAGR